MRSAHASTYPWVKSVLLGANGLAPHCSPSFHAFVCCYRELSTEKTSFIVAHPVCCPHKAGQHRSWWGCSCFPCWPWRLPDVGRHAPCSSQNPRAVLLDSSTSSHGPHALSFSAVFCDRRRDGGDAASDSAPPAGSANSCRFLLFNLVFNFVFAC